MLGPEAADQIAEAYKLGDVVEMTGPTRGEQGQVWRLVTSTGQWAVKETFHELSESEASRIAGFQAAAQAAGVGAPAVLATGTGAHLATVEADLPSRPLGRQPPRHRCEWTLPDRLGQLRTC